MQKINEYFIKDGVVSAQTVYMTTGAQVVHASEENGVVTLFALAEATEFTTELRSFEIHGTGELFSAETVKYVASYSSAIGTRHVFEILT